MSTPKLLQLISTALPKDVEPSMLRQYGKSEWWDSRPRMACAYSLRKCPSLDWQRYLLENLDVTQAGLDPVWHFVNHGLFEGRKLYSRQGEAEEACVASPAVSVIVYNYNRSLFLPKTLGSVFGQTMKNLEVILVDDCSTDESTRYAMHLADGRLRVMRMNSHLGPHACRKAAVGASLGNGIMFLDAGDYLDAQACEIAFDELSKGYDIVDFNLNIIGTPHADISAYLSRCNIGARGSRHNANGIRAIYRDKSLSSLMISKIFRGETCRRRFKHMHDGCADSYYEDYEMVSLAMSASEIAKLDYRLYSRRLPAMHDVQSPDVGHRDGAEAMSVKLIAQSIRSNGYIEFASDVLDPVCIRMIDNWLDLEESGQITSFFNFMVAQIGISELICLIQRKRAAQWERIAEQFRKYRIDEQPRLPVKRIGILYSVLLDGGAERVIIDTAGALLKRGYEVVLFLEEGAKNDIFLPPEVIVHYLGKRGGGGPDQKKHLEALRSAINADPVDVMMCHACYSGNLLWQLMLIKHEGIPVILQGHSSFFMPLALPGNEFNLQAIDALMRCGEKVIVLSRYDELYYRCRGVDAKYIPNPVRMPVQNGEPRTDFVRRKNNILVFGRLGDPVKNITDTLRVLADITKIRPWIKMIFVGSFYKDVGKKEFFDLSEKLGVEKNIEVTGWQENPTAFIDGCAVLLSTAYSESFSLTLVEAQARGLPAVIYNLPIMPAENNESVIRVPQGDHMEAAEEILKIIGDENLWSKLSEIAKIKAQRFSPEHVFPLLDDLLHHYSTQSSFSSYTPEEYRIVMRTLGFYGAHRPPWQKRRS